MDDLVFQGSLVDYLVVEGFRDSLVDELVLGR